MAVIHLAIRIAEVDRVDSTHHKLVENHSVVILGPKTTCKALHFIS